MTAHPLQVSGPFNSAFSGSPLPRRAVLAGAALLALPLPAAADPTPAGALDDAAFLRLSQTATGHADLDAIQALRTYAALRGADAAFTGHAAALAGLAQPGTDPEALLAAADAAGLRVPLLTLVAAWYTGTVGDGPDAVVVAYADALMYRPIADAVPVPTYCGNGPLWWTVEPPALGVSVRRPSRAG